MVYIYDSIGDVVFRAGNFPSRIYKTVCGIVLQTHLCNTFLG